MVGELLQDLLCPAECSADMLKLQAVLHGGHKPGPTLKYSQPAVNRCTISNTNLNIENDEFQCISVTIFEGGARLPEVLNYKTLQMSGAPTSRLLFKNFRRSEDEIVVNASRYEANSDVWVR